MNLKTAMLAASIALVPAGVAVAGGKSTANSPAATSDSSATAVTGFGRVALTNLIGQMVASGSGGTITLDNGTQIFVSVTGTLITSTSGSITADNVNSSDCCVIYEGTSATVASYLADAVGDFVDQAVSDSDGEFDPNQGFSIIQ